MQAYHRGMKAEGGWGACCTEYCSIHPESDDTSRVSARIWDEGDVRNLAAMCDRLHQFGALAGIELWYGGPHAPCMETRATPRGPSQIASDFELNIFPRYMDQDDIDTVQQMYVDAAIRAREAGFDIVYVYGAHAYLPFQFLSPFYNRRTDKYGGSFENRARFWRESLEKVREAVGDDCAIASRFAVDHLLGPISIQVGEDGARFVEYCDDLVDLWDLTVGDIAEWGQNAGPSRFFEENHEKPYTGRSRPATTPTSRSSASAASRTPTRWSRSSTPASSTSSARRAPRSRIRSCPRRSRRAGSTTSASASAATSASRAGRSAARRWSAPRTRPPARSTAAAGIPRSSIRRPTATRACCRRRRPGRDGVRDGARQAPDVGRAPRRGATSEIGGCVNWISQLGHSDGKENLFRGSARGPGRVEADRQLPPDPARQALERRGAPSARALSAEEVLDYGAEIVIVATGCHFATDGLNAATHAPIEGADTSLDWQLTPDQVVGESKRIGKRVLVLENEAYFMGVSVAQKLAGEGHEVTLVTQAAEIADYMDYTLEAPMLHRDLDRLGVDIHTYTMLEKIEPGVCHAYDVWNPAHKEQFEVDTVVLCTARISDDELYRELKADKARLEARGDRAVCT